MVTSRSLGHPGARTALGLVPDLQRWIGSSYLKERLDA
jgi:hypothetical protein